MDGLIPIYERHPPIGHTPIGRIRDVPIGYQSDWLGPLLKGSARARFWRRQGRDEQETTETTRPGRLQDYPNSLQGPAAHRFQWPWEQRLTILTTTSRPTFRPDHPSSHTSSTTYYLRKYLPVITNKLLNIRVNTNVSLTKPLQYIRVKETYVKIESKQPGSWFDKTVKSNYDIMIRERKIKKPRNGITTDNLALSIQNIWDPRLAQLYFGMNFKIFHGVFYGGIDWNKSGQCPMCNRLYDNAEHLFVRCAATRRVRTELAMRLDIPVDQLTIRQTVLMTYDNKDNKIYTYYRKVTLTLRQKGNNKGYNAKLALIRMLDNDNDVT